MKTFFLQVRLTDALVSSLEFKKGKDAELAWLDSQIVVRNKGSDVKPLMMETDQPEQQQQEKGMYKWLQLSSCSNSPLVVEGA